MINGVVYKLFCKDYNDCYVGSTTDFHQRKRQHKTNWNNENSKNYNLKVYKFIREHNGFDSWEFEVLEQNEYENKYLLRDREANFVKILKSTLNSAIPNRTQQEYYENNKGKIKEYHKEYSKNNKEKLNEYSKIYRENNKEKLNEYNKKYNEDNKDKLNEYRENNKEHRKEYDKKYREDNLDKIKEYKKEKVLCIVCNCYIRRNGLSEHKKTKKHIKNLNKS